MTHKQRNIGRFLFLAALYVGIYLICMAMIGSAVSGYFHDSGRQMLAKPVKADIGLGSIANFKR